MLRMVLWPRIVMVFNSCRYLILCYAVSAKADLLAPFFHGLKAVAIDVLPR